ncbi:NACHT domain-containing protein [Spirosoma foliorum]|uniref:NACHT domain-containing protein n=1 Tax=Spirosoma foliorum TaxID=2710596 RepID=A0A7G5GRN4_9BACT|nr:hypothetical protein [Spirosoma foliorum]QMW01526.1 hypothetical protein H3H32_26720 [Spirosoma foliorum]
MKSKLIQAGDLVRTVNLENVFVDLYAERITNTYDKQKIKIVDFLLKTGNNLNRSQNSANKFVIIGGAGAGKSTITQFISQYYTAHFLKSNTKKRISNIDNFLKECRTANLPELNCLRFPIKIILKDYAGWINDKQSGDNNISVIQYIRYRINNIADAEIDLYNLRDILKKLSFIFIFDGLDEVPPSSNRAIVIKEINDFIEIELEDAQCDSLIISTTRPQGYTKEFNADIYEHLTLVEMPDETCLEYLKKLLKNIESSPDAIKDYYKTLSDALKNDITGRLMRTPLQATIMTILVTSGGEPSINKYQLFKKYYDTIYNREKQKKVSKLINAYETQINQIHNLLGFQLQSNAEKSNNLYSNMDLDKFEDLISEYLKGEAWKDQEINIFINDFKNTITHRLVFITEVQDKKVGFVVRSLQEFFAAIYYMDTSEQNIRTNILNIATSAYWRNTLIFSIGYLRINKEYLVNDVFAICEELNGLGLPAGYNNIKASIKSGSWLSLDILTEGIINDAKKFLYKFVTLLEPLLDISLINEHAKFNKLDNSLKQDWIVNIFLKKRLSKENTVQYYSTICEVSCMMLATSSSEKAIQIKDMLYSSVNKNQKLVLIDKLYKFQEIDDRFISLFTEILLEYPKLSLEKIIIRELGKSLFIINLLDTEINNGRNIIIKRIIEEFILISLDTREELNKDIVNTIVGKIANKRLAIYLTTRQSKSITYGCFKNNTLLSYGHIEVTLLLTQSKNTLNIYVLKNICEQYNIPYLYLYFTYLFYPTLSNLINFFNSLDLESLPVKEKFSSTITNDWLFNFITKSSNNTFSNTNIYLQQINLIKDEDIVNMENNLITSTNDDIKLKLASSRTFRIDEGDASVKKIIEALNLQHGHLNIDTLNSFISIYGLNKTFQKTKIKAIDIDLITRLLANENINFKFINQSDFILCWFYIITDGNKQVIYETLQQNDCFTKIHLDNFEHFYHFLFSETPNQIFYKKFVDILNVFLNLDCANNSIILLGYILLAGDELAIKTTKELLTRINFKNLVNVNYISNEARISKFLILLFSETNPWKNNHEVSNEFKMILAKVPLLFKYFISIINSLKIDNIWVIEFIIELVNSETFLLIEDDFTKSAYFTYLKNVNEVQRVIC